MLSRKSEATHQAAVRLRLVYAASERLAPDQSPLDRNCYPRHRPSERRTVPDSLMPAGQKQILERTSITVELYALEESELGYQRRALIEVAVANPPWPHDEVDNPWPSHPSGTVRPDLEIHLLVPRQFR